MKGARFPGVGIGGGIDCHSNGTSSVSIMHENRPNMRQRVHPQQEITIRPLCSNDKVGGNNGNAGTLIQGLQRDTSNAIKIVNFSPEED